MPFSKKRRKKKKERNQLFAILTLLQNCWFFLFNWMQKVSLKMKCEEGNEIIYTINMFNSYFVLKPLYFKTPSVCCPNKGNKNNLNSWNIYKSIIWIKYKWHSTHASYTSRLHFANRMSLYFPHFNYTTTNIMITN